ncbi:hypothetical protein X961_4890 [Burkholderia pseudomallei MSHR5613]|nr:hypothetical protein X961_4890 [Burkholderia pseudomallei MSHR5613]
MHLETDDERIQQCMTIGMNLLAQCDERWHQDGRCVRQRRIVVIVNFKDVSCSTVDHRRPRSGNFRVASEDCRAPRAPAPDGIRNLVTDRVCAARNHTGDRIGEGMLGSRQRDFGPGTRLSGNPVRERLND